MPDVFIQAVAYVIGSYGTAATVIGTALFYAATIAATVAYSNAQRRRAERQARDSANADLQDRLVMVPLVGVARSRVYGEVRNVEGPLFKATRGANSEFYTMVISLAGHKVHAIGDVYFGDTLLELDVDGWVQTEPWLHSTKQSAESSAAFVTPGAHSIALANAPIGSTVVVTQIVGSTPVDQYWEALTFSIAGSTVNFTTTQPNVTVTVAYQWTNTVSKMRVRKFLGGPAQDLSSILVPLFPALLTSDDRFAGDACLLVDMEYDRDAYPSGVKDFSAVIQGADDVYDPRTATSGYTANPALCAADWAYYQFGGDFPAGTVHEQDTIDAANASDVVHTFTNGSGSTDRPLYTCGIVCRTDTDPSATFDKIVDSMAGKWGWSGGILRMRAGTYRAPVATVTEDWITDKSAITVVPEAPVAEAINIIRPSIADEAQAYVLAPAPDVRAEAYITLDTRELPTSITYSAVTDVDHAQHISGVKLREERSGLVASLPCNYRALKVEYLDPIQIGLPYFGWDDKVFEIDQYEFSAEGGVVLNVRETGPSIFDPDALFEESDATPNTQLPDPFNVPVPSGLTLESGTNWLLRQSDGTLVSRLHVEWTPITDAAVVNGGAIEVRYGPAERPESEWTSFEVPGGDSHVNISGVLDGRFYIVKLRARNALVRGDWCAYEVEQIVGKSAAPADVTGLTATIVQSGVRIDWDRATDLDYAATELRRGTVWATATPIFHGAANTYTWLAPPVASYTVLAKHVDTTGHESSTEASVAFVVDAAAAVQWADVAGKPFDTINLVQTPFFEGGDRRNWNGGSVVTVAGHDWTKALQISQRDTYETGGAVPVRAGEQIYGAADFDTSGTSYACSLGFICLDAVGTIINFIPCCTLAAGNAWTRISGSGTVPAGTATIIPWIQINGTSGFGNLLAANLFLSRAIPTYQLEPGAATDVPFDTYDFGVSGDAGIVPNGGPAVTIRSFTYTPPVNVTIEFTATVSADKVLPDSGNSLDWTVDAGGGGDTQIAYCNSDSGSRQTFPGMATFAASAGVTLTFKLRGRRASGNPAITLYFSTMRATAIKR